VALDEEDEHLSKTEGPVYQNMDSNNTKYIWSVKGKHGRS